jgi:hypothetical protein
MFSTFKRCGLALLALALSGFGSPACLPTLQPEPEPTPSVLQINLSPSLDTLRPLMKRCAGEQPNLGLVVSGSLKPDIEQSDLAIQWGTNNLPGGFAAVLGEETLVFVVNLQNPLDEISWADIQAIYQGERHEWPAGGPTEEIHPFAYPDNMDTQQIFVALAGPPPLPSNVTYLAPDPAAMVEVVSANQAAIGFIPQRRLDERVKSVRIVGLEESRLRQPVLSLSKSEPEGPQKTWLLCLQDGLVE